MKKREVITYLANPYNKDRGQSMKGTIFNKTGRIVKNDYLKFDMTSQRGNK
jgi:hypothetical protein